MGTCVFLIILVIVGMYERMSESGKRQRWAIIASQDRNRVHKQPQNRGARKTRMYICNMGIIMCYVTIKINILHVVITTGNYN